MVLAEVTSEGVVMDVLEDLESEVRSVRDINPSIQAH